MTAPPATNPASFRALRSALAKDINKPTQLAKQALVNPNQNPCRNTYRTPFSLAATWITISCPTGGMQLATARDAVGPLLQVAALIGARKTPSAPALKS